MADGHLPGGVEWAAPRVVYEVGRRLLEPVCHAVTHTKDLGASLLAEVGIEMPCAGGEESAMAEASQPSAAEGAPDAA